MNDFNQSAFPNLRQSFVITGIIILLSLIFSPVVIFLPAVTGEPATLLIYYLLTFGTSFWIANKWRLRKAGNNSFNFRIKNFRILPLITLGTVALMIGVTIPIQSQLPMSEFWEELFRSFADKMTGIYGLITVVFAAAIFEELIFRGIILDGLLKKYSPVTAIILSSLLFGIVHLNPWQFVTAMIAGGFLGWVYYKTRNILYPIIIHAVNNLTGFLLINYTSYDDTEAMTIQMIIIGVLVFIGSLLLLHLEFKRNKHVTFRTFNDKHSG